MDKHLLYLQFTTDITLHDNQCSTLVNKVDTRHMEIEMIKLHEVEMYFTKEVEECYIFFHYTPLLW